MSLVGKKASCINLDQDVKAILIHEYGINNLSEFINSLLWSYVEANEPEVPVEVKRALRAQKLAAKLRAEHQNQKKLIEEARSYEQIVREMKERDEITFHEMASQVLEDPDRYLKFLPEFSSGDMSEYWQQKAKTLSQLCGFPVTIDSLYNYIREAVNA